MSMKHFDLIVESVIRDGMQDLKNNLDEQLGDIFGDLLASYLSTKYGSEELERIKQYLLNYQINVVFAYADVQTNVPCISIQIIQEQEDTSKAGFMDISEENDTAKEPDLIVPPFNADSYDDNSGRIICNSASPNLGVVRINNRYKDGNGNLFKVLGPIYNDIGNKAFYIDPKQTVNLIGGQIQSAIDFDRTEIRYTPSNEQLLIGIHSDNMSFTKWLYHIVKYILMSRKADMQSRGCDLMTYSGTDLHMSMNLLPERIRSRFIMFSALITHTWNAGAVQLIDSIGYNATGVGYDIEAKIRVERQANETPREDEDNMTVGTVLIS